MNKLHVTIVHNLPVPAKKYGGTERVIWWLTQALTELGHRVSLVVPHGSFCPFAQVITFDRFRRRISDLIPQDADVVHGTDSFREKIDKPLIITHNGNGYPGDKFHPNTVFVSRDHARRHKSEMFVYNGINPAEYPAIQEEAKSPFCYFLAKARWKVKNVSGAIDVARAAGMPIQIIGGWRPSFRHDVRWRGMLGGEKKNEILRTGSALLFPVRWHEPFGIAVIEAMLTGSPVFGTPYGALPELITEETGFISNRKNDLANALKKYAEYDRKTLRKRVLDHFTHLHMAEKYLEYYHHVISGKTLNPHEPETLTRVSAQLLLEWQ